MRRNIYNLMHTFCIKKITQIKVEKQYKNYKIKDVAYIVSSEDYKIIQMKKQLNNGRKCDHLLECCHRANLAS